MAVKKNMGTVTVPYLVYKGSRKNGQITIGNQSASSPFRHFHFQEGGRYELDREVNRKVAVWLSTYHRQSFEIVEEEVEGDKAFVVAFANLIAKYKPILDMDKYEDFLPLIEQGFAHEGSQVKIKKVIPRKKPATKKTKEKAA